MNEVYESLKQYYEENGEIMPPTQFASEFHGNVSESEAEKGVIEFSRYLDSQRGIQEKCS